MFKIRTLIRYNQAYCEQKLDKLKLKHNNSLPAVATVFCGTSLTNGYMMVLSNYRCDIVNMFVIAMVTGSMTIMESFIFWMFRELWYDYRIKNNEAAFHYWNSMSLLDDEKLKCKIMSDDVKQFSKYPLVNQIGIMRDLIADSKNKKC